MYGNDTAGGFALATTGTVIGVAHFTLIGAVLIFAALALFTTVKVVNHRRTKEG